MRKLIMEQETLATIIDKAIESGCLVTCERCEISTLSENMFGSVCTSCAKDLVEYGLKKEEDEMLEEMAKNFSMQSAYDAAISNGAIEFEVYF